GGAAVFPALGQGSFRGTTPTELDEYSKAFYPPSYQPYIGFHYYLDSRPEEKGAVNPAEDIDASGLSTDLDVCDDCPWLRLGAGGNQMLLKGDSRLGLGVGRNQRLEPAEPNSVEEGFQVGTWNLQGPRVFWDPNCASFRSDESKSFLAPRWMGLRYFREDTRNVPPTYHVVTQYMTAPPSSTKLLGDFCVQAIRAQFYGMIGRRRHLIAVYSPALIVDE
ncbi:hypothetical protein HID58_074155, partial [Brassica napus]